MVYLGATSLFPSSSLGLDYDTFILVGVKLACCYLLVEVPLKTRFTLRNTRCKYACIQLIATSAMSTSLLYSSEPLLYGLTGKTV